MFTLQSGQIENALRGAGVPDISAKEMMQGVANCAAPVEHRGAMALTKPSVNYFPTIRPSGPSLKFTQDNRTAFNVTNTLINIPPWQNVPFTPLPYLPIPPWETIPYPGWPTGPYEEDVLTVQGPVRTGPIAAPAASVTNLTTNEITNRTDIRNDGDVVTNEIVNRGDAFIGGSQTIQNNLTVNGPVTNNNTVTNRAETYNNVVHNQFTHHHGPTWHYAETHLEGPSHFHGPSFHRGPSHFHGPTFANGRPLARLNVDVVTDVTWDGTTLSQTKKTLRIFGRSGDETTETVLDCSV